MRISRDEFPRQTIPVLSFLQLLFSRTGSPTKENTLERRLGHLVSHDVRMTKARRFLAFLQPTRRTKNTQPGTPRGSPTRSFLVLFPHAFVRDARALALATSYPSPPLTTANSTFPLRTTRIKMQRPLQLGTFMDVMDLGRGLHVTSWGRDPPPIVRRSGFFLFVFNEMVRPRTIARRIQRLYVAGTSPLRCEETFKSLFMHLRGT